MLVIFEGVDGSGKTTLAKLLAEKIGAVYIKPLAGQEGKLRDLGVQGMKDPIVDLVASDIARELSDAGQPVICDRSLVSVFVYQMMTQAGPPENHLEIYDHWIQNILPKDHLIIHLRRDLEECHQNRPNRFPKWELKHLDICFRSHIELVEFLGAKTMPFFNGLDPESSADLLVERIRNRDD